MVMGFTFGRPTPLMHTPDIESRLNLPVTGSSFRCKSDALDCMNTIRDVPLKPCDNKAFKMEIDTPILESLKTDSQMSHEINIKSESIDNICVKSDIINEVDSQQNQAHNIGFPIHGTNVIYPYHIQDRIKTDCFSQNLVTELKGSDFNLAYIQKHGFDVPVLFRDKEGLGLKVPGPKFSVRHVRMYIGSKYDLEVFDVGSGRTGLMLMKDFYKYYRDPNKDRLLDVLSLEFSHTKMNNLMLAPSVVRELDWAECTWPKNMKQAHSSHKALKYPKVQKYCLLSVKGCYTDFHTEIGGSSSWYHVVRGKKIFWLIPPTEQNLELYEQWLVSEKSPSTFLGDKVEKCGRCILSPGETLLIPSGWLHAVYAQRDTLMFGGKFLHSFGIDAQLKVAKLEKIRRKPRSSRYPLFTEMLWFVLEGYVHRLLGHSYCSEEAKTEVESDICHTHLTPQVLL
uniref:JmjC domain-containing protein n=1 Tax=Timema douglasi TaxID=61478 RepID=A0A7R8VID0_TIMDO|nr:unnamed protein product [Timema douglasi]